MRKQSIAVAVIESLFPADAKSPHTAEIGEQLCLRAIALNWRLLPDQVLETYRRLCEVEEKFQNKKMF